MQENLLRNLGRHGAATLPKIYMVLIKLVLISCTTKDGLFAESLLISEEWFTDTLNIEGFLFLKEPVNMTVEATRKRIFSNWIFLLMALLKLYSF